MVNAAATNVARLNKLRSICWNVRLGDATLGTRTRSLEQGFELTPRGSDLWHGECRALDRWRCRRVRFVDSRTDWERAPSSLGGMVVRFDNHFLAIDPAVVKMRTDSSRLTLLKNLREINAQPARQASGTVHLPLHHHGHSLETG